MEENSSALPEGYQSMPGHMDYLGDAVSLINKHSQYFLGVNEVTRDRLENDWNTPGFDPEDNTRLVLSPGGSLVGEAEVWDLTHPPVHPWAWMAVNPQCEFVERVRMYLLGWCEDRCRQVLDKVDPELRVAMRFWTYHENKALAELLEARGISFIRHSFRMRYEIDGPPPQPVWPEGVSVRRFDPQEDAEDVYRVDDEAFKDHFGYVEEPFEEGFRRFMHHMTGHEAYDPDLWFLAEKGDEIIGICLCRKWTVEDRDAGYITSLGVRRPWRRQGIALALLHHAFNAFYERGKSRVDLAVDAENLTGAMRLYEKAGMYVCRQYDMFEKEFRPGKEISVTGLE